MSVLNEDKKFIFIHPYKTAGNTVRTILKENNALGKEVHQAHSIAKHVKVAVENNYGTGFWNECFKFAFVRNPYSWILSTYFYIRCSKGHGKHELIKNKSFEQFLDWYEDELKIEIEYGRHSHIRLVDFILDDTGNNLMDFVGKMENFNNDMLLICNRIGIEYKPIVKNVNSNYDRNKWKQFYTNKARKHVEKILESDLLYFNYSWESQ